MVKSVVFAPIITTPYKATHDAMTPNCQPFKVHPTSESSV
jgi:hypothetical protein